MSVAISSAMAGVAASQAAVASAAAHKARVSLCQTMMPSFNAQQATVSEMREYAGCVETLYPNEIGTDVTIVLKVLFVLAIVGMAIGVWRDRRYGLVESVMNGVLWFLIVPVAIVSSVCFLMGLRWLFS